LRKTDGCCLRRK